MGRSSKNTWWQVQKIVDSRVGKSGKPEYQIKWKGWKSQYNTWESEANLETVVEMIEQFEKTKKKGIKKKQTKTKSSKNSLKRTSKKELKKKRNRKSKSQSDKGRGLPTKNIFQQFLINSSKQTKSSSTDQITGKSKLQSRDNTANLNFMAQRTQKLKTIERKSLDTQENMIESRNLDNQPQQHSQEEEEQDDDEVENIQQILKECNKIEEATLFFKDNSIYFEIPFKDSEGVRRISLSRQQIFKVNPGWLTSLYQGYIL